MPGNQSFLIVPPCVDPRGGWGGSGGISHENQETETEQSKIWHLEILWADNSLGRKTRIRNRKSREPVFCSQSFAHLDAHTVMGRCKHASSNTEKGSRSGPEGGSALLASSHREAPACCSCSEQHGGLGPCRVWLLSHPTKQGVLSPVSHTLCLSASACCYGDCGGQEMARSPSLSWPQGRLAFPPVPQRPRNVGPSTRNLAALEMKIFPHSLAPSTCSLQR